MNNLRKTQLFTEQEIPSAGWAKASSGTHHLSAEKNPEYFIYWEHGKDQWRQRLSAWCLFM